METSNRAKAFREWLDTATAGHHYVYFRGSLINARGRFENIEDEIVYTQNEEISELANAVWETYKAGRVHLFQRKLHDNEYEYIAVKRYMPVPLWMPDGALEIVDG